MPPPSPSPSLTPTPFSSFAPSLHLARAAHYTPTRSHPQLGPVSPTRARSATYLGRSILEHAVRLLAIRRIGLRAHQQLRRLLISICWPDISGLLLLLLLLPFAFNKYSVRQAIVRLPRAANSNFCLSLLFTLAHMLGRTISGVKSSASQARKSFRTSLSKR